jgi:hypothetical protein
VTIKLGVTMNGRNRAQPGSLLAALVLALGLATRGYGQAPAYDLCIEQSPAQAGKLMPDPGTHRFAPDAVVVLSAEPQPGYQFVYWLGDVADPKAQRTTVQLNSPKMVIAVFQPAPKDYPEEVLVAGGGGRGGTAAATGVDLSVPGWSPTGGGKGKPEVIIVPAQVPEPATIALLALGCLALRRKLR